MSTHLVVMGVAGTGKSTVMAILAERLGWESAEGDDFHPAANVAAMRAGTPLTDEDRWPWLASIADWTAEADRAGRNTIVTCSALRRAYRDVLRTAPGRTVFVHLRGADELIAARIEARTGHYMPATLLPSQVATLEPLAADEDGFAVDVTSGADEVAETVLARLGR